jgi:hypothetical protein
MMQSMITSPPGNMHRAQSILVSLAWERIHNHSNLLQDEPLRSCPSQVCSCFQQGLRES